MYFGKIIESSAAKTANLPFDGLFFRLDTEKPSGAKTKVTLVIPLTPKIIFYSALEFSYNTIDLSEKINSTINQLAWNTHKHTKIVFEYNYYGIGEEYFNRGSTQPKKLVCPVTKVPSLILVEAMKAGSLNSVNPLSLSYSISQNINFDKVDPIYHPLLFDQEIQIEYANRHPDGTFKATLTRGEEKPIVLMD